MIENYIGLTSAHKGIAVIISNSYTRENISLNNDCRLLQPLSNSLEDSDKLKEAFEHLKFFTIVKYDVTKGELLSLLSSYMQDFSCLQVDHQVIFAFFGYGENDTVYCEDERSISVSKIIRSIVSDAPRLFFFDISHSAGIFAHKEEERWQSKIIDAENVLVAFVTAMEYKTSQNSLWSGMLANKLLTSRDDIYNVIMEVNWELMEVEGALCVQQPELYSTLNTTVII